MYNPSHFYIQVDRDRKQFEEMMASLQENMSVSRRQEAFKVKLSRILFELLRWLYG